MAVDPLSLDFGRDKKWCVYIYRDPRIRKKKSAIYVGKGDTKVRPDSHWKHGSHNVGLKAALREIKKAGHQPVIEYIGFFDDEEAAFELEISLIKQFGRRSEGGSLYNLSPGGRASLGTKTLTENILATEIETPFRSWRIRLRLTIAGAGKALDRSPRQISSYDNEPVSLPRVVELAMVALEDHPEWLPIAWERSWKAPSIDLSRLARERSITARAKHLVDDQRVKKQ